MKCKLNNGSKKLIQFFQSSPWKKLCTMLLLVLNMGILYGDPIGNVVSEQGNVTARMDSHPERQLQENSPLYENDTIFVGKDSVAQIALNDGTAINLLSDTVFSIETFLYQKNTKNSQFLAQLFQGGFRLLTGNIASGNPDQYQVKTPVSTIGIRGTIIDVYTTAKETDISVIHGKVEFSSTTGQVTVAAKQFAIATSGKAPYRVETTPPLLAGRNFSGKAGGSSCQTSFSK